MILSILTILCYIFDCIILLIYFNSILGQRKKNIPLPAFILGIILIYAILYFQYEIITIPYGPMGITITMSFSVISTFILTLYYSSSLRHRIFVTLSFQVFCILSEFPAGILLITFSRLLSHSESEPDEFIILLFSKLILFLFVVLTKIVWNRKKEKKSLQYNLLIIVTPLVTIIITLFLPNPSTNNYQDFLSCVVTICGMLILNLANYFLLNNILKVKELEEQQRLLNNQLSFQANKYTQISTAYRSTRSILHDTKKHFFYLEECITNKEYDKIQSYLKTSMEKLERSYSRINTGNLVIDAFVSNHMEMATQENVTFKPNINITKEDIPIEDYDLCIVLGNLLDNSIQACRKVLPPKPRTIEINLCTTHKEFVIHIKNTMVPKDDATYDSSDTLYHGYGLENVKNIVKKYYGNYSFFIRDTYFETVITIPIMNIQI